MGDDREAPQLDQPAKAAVLDLWRDGHRPFTLTLEGLSMDPVALPGDRVTIHPCAFEHLRCGDVVALLQGETVVVHRFLMERVAEDGRRELCQKGDNSPAWSWVPPEKVLGRVETILGPDRSHHLTHRPWTWINPLAGRLGRLGMRSHRLSRILLVPLIRLGHRRGECPFPGSGPENGH